MSKPDEENTLQYLLMIYMNEARQAGLTETELDAEGDRYTALTRRLKADGRFIAGDGLQPSDTGTTVRRRGGQLMTTDGPYAETKEQLGGYYLIEAEHLDEALEVAALIPAVDSGAIEVRPVMIYKPSAEGE